MSNISTVPQLQRDLAVSDERDYNIPIQDLRDLLARSSRRTYINQLNSERGKQTIAKAVRYNIPFDWDDIDFLDLMDKIADYEYLLKQAVEIGIDWEESDYDMAELKCEIEMAANEPERGSNDNNQFRRDYYASIAL